jgi:ATP-dependent RNA helicase MSS116
MVANPEGGKALVFLPTTRLTEVYTQILTLMQPYMPWGMRKTEIVEIHSRKTQQQRDRASERFRRAKGGYQILVSCDVSARGVDYPNVTRVNPDRRA